MSDIGDPIDTDIPAVGTFGTAYASDINDILEEVVDRLTRPCPVSSIENDGGDTLDMNNGPFLNARFVHFYEQSEDPDGAPTGRIVYYAGNFYAVTSSGAIQITDGTGLSTTVDGGIGGDYGSPNPASVIFTDSSETYSFFDDIGLGEWAILKAKELHLVDETTARSVRIKPSTSIAATHDLTLPLLPATGPALLTISSAGLIGLAESANAAAVSSILTFSADPVLATTTKIKHGSRYLQFPGNSFVITTGINNVEVPSDGSFVASDTSNGGTAYYNPPVQRTWRIKTVKVLMGRVGAGTVTMTVTTQDMTGNPNTPVTTDNNTTASTGTNVSLTVTLATPHVMAANEILRIAVDLPNTGSANTVKYVEIEYDVI